MNEINYLKDSKVEITAKRIEGKVYICQDSVINLLKDYKKQLRLGGVMYSKNY